METHYVYLLSFVSVCCIVLLPPAVIAVSGSVPDVEPYGVFSVVNNIVGYALDFITSLLKFFILSNDIDTQIDEINTNMKEWFNNIAKVYTLIPPSVYIIIFIPLFISFGYALLKALPGT